MTQPQTPYDAAIYDLECVPVGSRLSDTHLDELDTLQTRREGYLRAIADTAAANAALLEALRAASVALLDIAKGETDCGRMDGFSHQKAVIALEEARAAVAAATGGQG